MDGWIPAVIGMVCGLAGAGIGVAFALGMFRERVQTQGSDIKDLQAELRAERSAWQAAARATNERLANEREAWMAAERATNDRLAKGDVRFGELALLVGGVQETLGGIKADVRELLQRKG